MGSCGRDHIAELALYTGAKNPSCASATRSCWIGGMEEVKGKGSRIRGKDAGRNAANPYFSFGFIWCFLRSVEILELATTRNTSIRHKIAFATTKQIRCLRHYENTFTQNQS